jgi:hypothetical protein
MPKHSPTKSTQTRCNLFELLWYIFTCWYENVMRRRKFMDWEIYGKFLSSSNETKIFRTISVSSSNQTEIFRTISISSSNQTEIFRTISISSSNYTEIFRTISISSSNQTEIFWTMSLSWLEDNIRGLIGSWEIGTAVLLLRGPFFKRSKVLELVARHYLRCMTVLQRFRTCDLRGNSATSPWPLRGKPRS